MAKKTSKKTPSKPQKTLTTRVPCEIRPSIDSETGDIHLSVHYLNGSPGDDPLAVVILQPAQVPIFTGHLQRLKASAIRQARTRRRGGRQ